jgi:hypothetical protein
MTKSSAAFIGEASCLAERACRDLIAAVVRLGEAGLGPSPELAALVDAVCHAAAMLTELADNEGARLAEPTR